MACREWLVTVERTDHREAGLASVGGKEVQPSAACCRRPGEGLGCMEAMMQQRAEGEGPLARALCAGV